MTYSYTTYYKDVPGYGRMAYIDEGTGDKTLVFIHGLANYAMVWQRNIDYLKQFYRCIALDLPGNGLSGKGDHAFGIRFYAESVCSFIHALQLHHVCLVGHSMGGQVAMTAVLNHPDCAEKLVLCAPAGFEEFSPFERSLFYSTMNVRDFLTSDESLLRQTIENSLFRHKQQAEGVIKELVTLMKAYKPGYYKKMVEASVKGMLEETVIGLLQLIRQPTLVLFGEEDMLIPNRLLHHTTTRQMAQLGTDKMPNAKLAMIPDAGHFVQWEKADEVNREIAGFVR